MDTDMPWVKLIISMVQVILIVKIERFNDLKLTLFEKKSCQANKKICLWTSTNDIPAQTYNVGKF